MENLTADVVVGLYAKYQLYHYWFGVGLFCAIFFGFVGLLVFGISVEYEKTGGIFAGILLFLVSFAGVMVVIRSNYLIECVLKPEIARHVVPAGLDAISAVGKEVQEMWGLLKGLLK